jgi:hypothetical protein
MLHELREKDPDVFGPGGGSAKMFSLTEVSFNVGLLLGPLVCGSLSDAFGFEYTAWALGEYRSTFARRGMSLIFLFSWRCRSHGGHIFHLLHPQVAEARRN